MLLKLITVPEPILRQISQPVTQMNTKNVQFLKDMANTLTHKDDPPGVGLSAIQVGTPARIFMTYLPPIHDLSIMDDKQPPQKLQIFINPQIIDHSSDLTLGPDKQHPALEGCLSIPNLYGPVYRYQTIKLKYQTLDEDISTIHSNGRKINLIDKTEVFSHFFARVIQHEYDHLDAILFTDHTKQDGLPLYFDNGQNLTEIPKPEELINW